MTTPDEQPTQWQDDGELPNWRLFGVKQWRWLFNVEGTAGQRVNRVHGRARVGVRVRGRCHAVGHATSGWQPDLCVVWLMRTRERPGATPPRPAGHAIDVCPDASAARPALRNISPRPGVGSACIRRAL